MGGVIYSAGAGGSNTAKISHVAQTTPAAWLGGRQRACCHHYSCAQLGPPATVLVPSAGSTALRESAGNSSRYGSRIAARSGQGRDDGGRAAKWQRACELRVERREVTRRRGGEERRQEQGEAGPDPKPQSSSDDQHDCQLHINMSISMAMLCMQMRICFNAFENER